jgi:tellurite resistance protein
MTRARIERLRDRLEQQGQPTVRPPSMGASVPTSPEVDAMYARVRPLAEVMFLVMTADETVGHRERDTLRGAIRTLTGGVLSSTAMEKMISEFEDSVMREGVDVRLDYVASVLYGDRDDSELALSLAAAVAVADEPLVPAEQATIEELALRLGVSKERLRELVGDTGFTTAGASLR